jgi:hypothetical protein
MRSKSNPDYWARKPVPLDREAAEQALPQWR